MKSNSTAKEQSLNPQPVVRSQVQPGTEWISSMNVFWVR